MTGVILAEGLGKQYRRGVVETRGMLRDSIARFARAPLAALRRSVSGSKPAYRGQPFGGGKPSTGGKETFWALRDVCLEVKEGEVLGLIGRNGAGKTTLLKILSRITRPTTGWAEIRGHVRSLLEVGTGFHGELTGRENTYLSGSILGMRKREIDRKLDEIVAFAEIEKFIDTPVKHYSSGMYVRLAFAVAAHLEPEILLVDEVLAVGDINFQKKCLGKMGDVARRGRTVVLVSHQMNQMRRLCQRVVWVDGGQIRVTGPAHEVVSAYESAMTRGSNDGTEQERSDAKGASFHGWELTGPEIHDRYTLDTFGPIGVRFGIRVSRVISGGHHGIALFSKDGQVVWASAQDGVQLQPGEWVFAYEFPFFPVRPGPYTWRVSLYEGEECIDFLDCLPQMMVSTEPFGHPRDEWAAILNVPTEFQVNRKSPDAVYA
jgi:lipopolysaccharide transport system ATP-binding protein